MEYLLLCTALMFNPFTAPQPVNYVENHEVVEEFIVECDDEFIVEDEVMFSAFVGEPEWIEEETRYVSIDEDGEEVYWCEIEGEVDLFPEDGVYEDEEDE